MLLRLKSTTLLIRQMKNTKQKNPTSTMLQAMDVFTDALDSETAKAVPQTLISYANCK